MKKLMMVLALGLMAQGAWANDGGMCVSISNGGYVYNKCGSLLPVEVIWCSGDNCRLDRQGQRVTIYPGRTVKIGDDSGELLWFACLGEDGIQSVAGRMVTCDNNNGNGRR